MYKKNVIVFGDPGSILIKELIKKLSDRYSIKFDLKSLYRHNLIQYLLFERKNISSEIRKKEIKNIHFHYLSLRAVLLISYISKKNDCKIIVSLWGTDLNKDLKGFKRFLLVTMLFLIDLRLLGKVLKEVFTYTYTNQDFLKSFQNEWPNIRNHSNFSQCRWGSDLPTLTTKLLDSDKIRVTVGYNGRNIQQHSSILAELGLLSEKIKNKIFLILPFSYGSTEDYENYIEKCVLETGIEYKFIKTFLKKKSLASLRSNSEIFIQLQKTDQFSGSMLEYGCFGNIIITGSWLPYDELKNLDTFFTIEKINHLPDKLEEVLLNFKTLKDKALINSTYYKNIMNWENCSKNWNDLYE